MLIYQKQQVTPITTAIIHIRCSRSSLKAFLRILYVRRRAIVPHPIRATNPVWSNHFGTPWRFYSTVWTHLYFQQKGAFQLLKLPIFMVDTDPGNSAYSSVIFLFTFTIDQLPCHEMALVWTPSFTIIDLNISRKINFKKRIRTADQSEPVKVNCHSQGRNTNKVVPSIGIFKFSAYFLSSPL